MQSYVQTFITVGYTIPQLKMRTHLTNTMTTHLKIGRTGRRRTGIPTSLARADMGLSTIIVR
ncbi:MAG: hypothetical protein WBZ36_06645, partial [Candidatus Nitrosopolaris sp.]